MPVKATTVYSHVHLWASRVCVAIAMGSVTCRSSDPIANCLCFVETLLLACHTHFSLRSQTVCHAVQEVCEPECSQQGAGGAGGRGALP